MVKRDSDLSLKEYEVTDFKHFKERRLLIKAAMAGSIAGGLLPVSATAKREARKVPLEYPYAKDSIPEDLSLTEWDFATKYNNFYEFGVDKEDPAKNAHTLRPKPWSLKVTGLCKNTGSYQLEDLIVESQLVERIYRHRCVEAWAMVVPWIGIPLERMINRFEPQSSARYVVFKTLVDPDQMVGQRRNYLPWPYQEGLRLDEATNPLTLMTVGMYGSVLPNQNGAPLRLIVPWKYGFKGIKSIVEMSFVEEKPVSTWNLVNPEEYGFFANVNPSVNHPRWSQKNERKVGKFFRQRTLMFNGYADQVASMYQGMDLSVNY